MIFKQRLSKAPRRKKQRRAAALHNRPALKVEQLEARNMLSASPVGGGFLVNDLVVRDQSTLGSDNAAAISDVNSVAVFSGEGPVDSSGVFAKVYGADGTALQSTFRVNTTRHGEQHAATVDVAASGRFVVAWAGRGVGDHAGVFFQRYDAAGNALGEETLVNTTTGGTQSEPAVTMADDGSFAIAWSGVGEGDVSGIYLRLFDASGTALGAEQLVNTTTNNQQVDPAIATLVDGSLIVVWSSRHQDGSDWGLFAQRFDSSGSKDGSEFMVNSTSLRSQSDAAIVANISGGYTVTWNSYAQDGDGWGVYGRNFLVDGTPTGSEFILNDSTDGNQRNASISTAADGQLLATWTADSTDSPGTEVRVRNFLPSGIAEGASFAVNGVATSGHKQAPSVAVDGANALVVWSGEGSLDGNGVFGQRYTLATLDLVAFAQALANSGAEFFGAGWDSDSTTQKEIFQDGGQFLPFVETTNPDRTPNQAATDNSIAVFPTWILGNGTRLEGVQSLQSLSVASGIAIPEADGPFIASLPDETLLIGSPLHVSLDGYDPKGGPLTYTVTTNNADVTAEVLAGNRSARMSVAGYGDMVFELFEQRASRATDQFTTLAENDFYEDIIFHRVINNFVIQGGDPTGTGTGGSALGPFDDHFHADLQHNRTGLLSYAKSSDDTNDSQFFITEGATRHLDFNHSIFGVMTEGEANRDAISNTALSGSTPVNDVVIESVEIFDDTENAVLMLKAAPGTTGPVTVTVTVTDQDGNTFDRIFEVDVQEDTSNSPPFLGDIAPVTIAKNTTAQIQLTATDVEGDDIEFGASNTTSVNYTFDLSDDGLLEVTPPTDFVGTMNIVVSADRDGSNPLDDFQLVTISVV